MDVIANLRKSEELVSSGLNLGAGRRGHLDVGEFLRRRCKRHSTVRFRDVGDEAPYQASVRGILP